MDDPIIRIERRAGSILLDSGDAHLLQGTLLSITRSGNTSYVRLRTSQAGGARLQSVFLHRAIMLPPPQMTIDHINGNGLDNRRANLRVCSQAENMRNRRRSGHSKWPYKGIDQNPKSGKWRATIRVNHRRYRLGTFDSAFRAAKAYDAAAVLLHGAFARLNFPNH